MPSERTIQRRRVTLSGFYKFDAYWVKRKGCFGMIIYFHLFKTYDAYKSELERSLQ